MGITRNILHIFNSFGVKHIRKEVKTFIENKNVITNIYKTQAHRSNVCRYFCAGFIDFMLKGNRLLDYTN